MLIRSLPLLFLVAFAYADVKFTAPAAGGTIKVAPQITVQWTDDTTGKTPLADLVGYQVFLMAGGAQESNSVRTALSAEGHVLTRLSSNK